MYNFIRSISHEFKWSNLHAFTIIFRFKIFMLLYMYMKFKEKLNLHISSSKYYACTYVYCMRT